MYSGKLKESLEGFAASDFNNKSFYNDYAGFF